MGQHELSDLLQALEESSGRDLSFFTGQWLQTAGVNTLTSEYELDDRGRFSRFTVVQGATELWPTCAGTGSASACYDGRELWHRGRAPR